MLRCPTVDETKTLAQLTGVAWPIPGPDAKPHIQERYAHLAKPLADWTTKQLIDSFRSHVDEHILVPVAIGRLEANPLAAASAGEAAEGELLCHVLESTGFDWHQHPECVRRMRQIVGTVENQLFQIDEPWAQKTALLHLYRAHALFEMGISAVR